MSYFEVMPETEFDERFGDVSKEVCETLGMGFVPNIFRCLANVNPELALASWTMVKNNLCSGELSRVSKEILFSYIAYRQKCEYCHIAHHAMALKFGHSEQDILEIINNIDSVRNPLLKSVLQFGELCLNDQTGSYTEMYDKLDELGLDKEEVTELIGMVSCSLYMVNLANCLSVDVDTRFTDYTQRVA
jgi:AhpD family alkylhydroperoxidase